MGGGGGGGGGEGGALQMFVAATAGNFIAHRNEGEDDGKVRMFTSHDYVGSSQLLET